MAGLEENGFGEVAARLGSGDVEVAYYRGPVESSERRVPVASLARPPLPAQTRCFYEEPGTLRIGRILDSDGAAGIAERTYFVKFPNEKSERRLRESEFHVRSYVGASDPVATISSLAQETPFFFERRMDLVSRYDKQAEACWRLNGLVSSKIELFPHQVEVARRVLQDSTIRYLLADEVGLGKTIEAGIILRQLKLDMPRLRITILTPSVLVEQWRKELERRFNLRDIQVLPHESLLKQVGDSDVLVIDEAHRVTSTGSSDAFNRQLFDAACKVSHPSVTPHLLLLSATPVLHHEAEFLALLHLLDPDGHALSDLPNFRTKLEKRTEIGRALLALSRARHGVFIERQAARCAELLPDDDIVQHIARTIAATAAMEGTEDELHQRATDLRIHLTETYRVHRRMVRTRRTGLIEEGDFLQRRSEKEPFFESARSPGQQAGTSDALSELWRLLDEWRVHAAAHVVDLADAEQQRWSKDYLELAHALATDRAFFVELIRERLERGRPRFERGHLEQMRVLSGGTLDVSERTQGVVQLLRRLGGRKWVVFCGRAGTCEKVGAQLKSVVAGIVPIVATTNMKQNEITLSLERFRMVPGTAVLVVDEAFEEGLNLQFADGLILLDLPFDPMRLEQENWSP